MTGGWRFDREEERKKRRKEEDRSGESGVIFLDLARRLHVRAVAVGAQNSEKRRPFTWPAARRRVLRSRGNEKNRRDTRDTDGDGLATGYLGMEFNDWNRIVKCYVFLIL